MRIRVLAFGLAWTASLCAQHRRFSWQEACFKNPRAPYCSGHEYAVKPVPPAKDTAPRIVADNSFPSTPQNVTPSLIVVGGIDWRFADPFADTLAGFNFSRLSASPQARGLIAQLVASQGLTEADTERIFEGLCSAGQIVLSVRDNRIVMMLTGSVADSTALEPGWKAVPVVGNAMLLGHADAVDQAAQRIATEVPPPELARLAETLQSNEFWAVGSAGAKRFSLSVSIRDRLTTNLEFDGVPAAASMQGFPQIGQRLASLVKATRYLPVRGAPGAVHTQPVIYGLDGGPKEVNH